MTDGAFLGGLSKAFADERYPVWRQHPGKDYRTYTKAIAFKQLAAGSARFTTSAQVGYTQSSTIYKRTYNTGGGQFVTTSRHYAIGDAYAEVYALPFTVNQTTGAITVGTGAAGITLTNTTNTNIDTGTVNCYGKYVMHQHTSPGAGSNSFTAFRIANNAVAATATTITGGPQAQPQDNLEAPGNYNNATGIAYHHTQTYDTATGLFRRMSYSFNGTSVALVQSEAPSVGSRQAYSTVWSVLHPFGAANNSPTTGAGLRLFRDGFGCMQYDLLNLSGGYDATGNFQAVGFSGGEALFAGWGLELSNGRQIYYGNNCNIFVRNGNTITRVDEIADPHQTWRSFNNRQIWPVGVDTWVTMSTSGYELIKFSINPTTYKTTILEVFDFNQFVPDFNHIGSLNNWHVSLTGSSNQFLCVGISEYSNHILHNFWVFPNPFSA
jgi:hypothetical protein